MAMAYAAVVSLIHLMDQIHLYHARQPIFLHEQLIQLQSLNQLLCFHQDFLEVYSHGRSSKEMEALECRIANAAHAAEDIIESHIVDNIHARSNSHERRGPDHFSQALLEVIEGMDLIKKAAMETKENRTSKAPAPAPWSSTSPSKKDTVVVYDEDLNNILRKLADQQSSRQVIPITGMGGIGKTTLAKIAYENLFVLSHFDIRSWVTISQQYDIKELLLRLLKSMHVDFGQSNQESNELGMKLHQYLFGRRYLIVLDDMWRIEAWDELKSFLPENNCGSRIIMTSRILNVANNFASSNLYQMNLLDESKSWNLLCKKVFGEGNCPAEFVDVGKMIARNCKGLPLSIGTVGGLLAKSNMVREYWEYVSENTNTSVSSNDKENCLNILSLSYTHLPIHLKPCFLYLGVFSEDYEIPVSKIIKLWVAEGFLKPSRAKSLEQVGRDYLKDLIERNLLSISKFGCIGNVKYCKIHDLLRYMCLGEAQKENFLHIEAVYMPNNSQHLNMYFHINESTHLPPTFKLNNTAAFKQNNTNILKGTNNKRRIGIHLKLNERYTPRDDLLVSEPTSILRSLICDLELEFKMLVNFRLVRVFEVSHYRCSEDIFQQVNLRYLNFKLSSRVLPSSIYMLWNLHTIIAPNAEIAAPVEIWKMPQLKHVIVSLLYLPDPSPVSQMDRENDVIVLANLQTLSSVLNFRCTEEVVRKIPNVVKLKLKYGQGCDKPRYSLNNVCHLEKLQSLSCDFPDMRYNYLRHMVRYPSSLRKLTLFNVGLSWGEITTKIGPLPHLEKLKLEYFSSDDEWNPVEGHFLRLKYLRICVNFELLYWTTESVHFPVLEHLVVDSITNLKGLPSGIGDIATLLLIELRECRISVYESAKEILKEQQQSFGNEIFRLLVNGKPVIIDSGDEHSERMFN